MKNVVAKVTGSGNPNVLVTERGSSFGYNTLVVDMRALPQMAETGAPVIFDATHAVQQPGGQGTSSGGDRRFVPVLARAAVAVGVAGLFIETHQDPDKAPSDGPNMVPLKEFRGSRSPSFRRSTASSKSKRARTRPEARALFVRVCPSLPPCWLGHFQTEFGAFHPSRNGWHPWDRHSIASRHPFPACGPRFGRQP